MPLELSCFISLPYLTLNGITSVTESSQKPISMSCKAILFSGWTAMPCGHCRRPRLTSKVSLTPTLPRVKKLEQERRRRRSRSAFCEGFCYKQTLNQSNEVPNPTEPLPAHSPPAYSPMSVSLWFLMYSASSKLPAMIATCKSGNHVKALSSRRSSTS